MQEKNSIPLASLFGSIVQALQNDQPYLNHLDSNNGNGNHGDNMLQNFMMIANLLQQSQNQNMDAQQQMDQAANLLESQGRGPTASIYAQALRQAGQSLKGQPGLTANQVAPFLRGLLGGAQSVSGARVGQGTLMDSLVPGIEAYLNARNQGMTNQQAIVHGLTSALMGARQVQQQPSGFGNSRQNTTQPWVDPGAASGVSVLGGLFRQLSNL